jgi:quercetin dioxygenase-like cupin family protein
VIRSFVLAATVAAAVAASIAGPAFAQNAPVAGANAPPVPIVALPPRLDTNVWFAKDVPVVPMAEWTVVQQGAAEQTGARVLIAAGPAELGRAPPEASRYDSQTFRFPSGDIRVLTFRKASGGVLHQVTSEKSLYVVKGSAVVDVAGVATEIFAGDVVSLPAGVLRSRAGKAEDTTVVLFTVRDGVPNPKPAVLRARDAKPMVIKGGEKAGLGNTTVTVRRHAFDGNSIRFATLSGQGSTAPVVPQVDALIYVLSGPMQITIGDEVKTVSAGDALREPAGLSTHWDVPRKGSFIATNGVPLVPPAPAAPR